MEGEPKHSQNSCFFFYLQLDSDSGRILEENDERVGERDSGGGGEGGS